MMLRGKRGPGALVGLAVFWMSAAGCGGGGEHASAGRGDAAAGTPVHGGTLVVGFPQEPESLFPYGVQSAYAGYVLGFLFDMLADTNEDFGSFSPSLARAWEWSPDRRTLTMFLRDDVTWSDGVPLTAEDVAFTHEVASDSLVGWRTRHWKKRIRACEVVDRFTVRFRFDAPFLEQFRYAKEGWIIPKHLLAGVPRDQLRNADFARHPVGCGPFKLESWEPGQRLVLVRNERYFDAPEPYLDRVVLELLNEPATRVGRLRAGSLDLALELPRREAAELRQAQRAGKSDVRIVSARGRGYDYIGYNSNDPLFASPRVREALTRAIDRRAIVDALCHGFAEVFENPVVPILWAYDLGLPVTPYDPEGARSLLEAEGWRDTDGDGWLDKNGRRFEFTLTTNSDNPLRTQAMVPVQTYWRAVGVKADLQALEMQTALALRAERKYQAYYGGWDAGLSVTATLEMLWGCASRGSKQNFTDYCNPRVDSLNALAARALDPDEAKPLLQQTQALVVRDHPYTWMYYDHVVVGLGPRVQGVVVDARGVFINMDEWYIPKALQARPTAG
jgi:peptide/nickel transport system substrate-binding protein